MSTRWIFINKQIVIKFERNKVLVSDIDDVWQIDLIYMRAFKKENKDINYILTVIDVFSLYACGRIIKNKVGKNVKEAMKISF